MLICFPFQALIPDLPEHHMRCNFIRQNACGNSTGRDWKKYRISKKGLYCLDSHNKTYFFEKKKKTYDQAVKNCRSIFESPDFADLVQITDCREYEFIKEIIRNTTNRDGKLAAEFDNKGILVWTSIRSEVSQAMSDFQHESLTLPEHRFNRCPHTSRVHGPIEAETFSPFEGELTAESKNLTDNETIERYSICQLLCLPESNPAEEFVQTEAPKNVTRAMERPQIPYGTTTPTSNSEIEASSTSKFRPSEAQFTTTSAARDNWSTTALPVATTIYPQQELTTVMLEDLVTAASEMDIETTKHFPFFSSRRPHHHLNITNELPTIHGILPDIEAKIDQDNLFAPRVKTSELDEGEIFNRTKNITHALEHKDQADFSQLSDDLFELASSMESHIRQIAAKFHVNGGARDPNKDPPPQVRAIRDFTEHVVHGVSSALGRKELWRNMTLDQRSVSALKFIDTVNKMTQSMGCIRASNETINSTCIQLETVIMNSAEIPSSMSFPLNATEEVRHHIQFTANIPFDKPSNECPYNSISSVIFDDVDAHLLSERTLARDKSLFRKSRTGELSEIMMNSKLVSFSVGEEKNETKLLPNNSKVRIVFRHIHPLSHKDEVACVFWDKMDNVWSNTNCSVVSDFSWKNQTMCECNHLTNFAILMDISGRQKVDTVKSVLSIVCCSISIIGLILTLIAMILVKGLRNRRCIITCNLCLCLLAVNLMVIFALDRTSDVLICRIMSGTLLYLLLSSFAWMQLQGYLLYQMIILVFQSVGYVSNITLFIVGYVPSFIIVAIFVIITGPNGLYDPNVSYFCWISNQLHTDYIWAFAGPALLIIAINLVILVRSFRVAWQSQTTRTTKNAKLITALRFLKGWTSLVILVGATWLTGLLYIHQLVPWSDYVFISLNALQGAFIFLFEILLNSKTRSLLTKLPVSKLLSSLGSSHSSSGNGTGSTGCSKDKSKSSNGHRWSKSSSSTSNISAITPPATWYTNYFPSGSPPGEEEKASDQNDLSQNLAGIYSRGHEHHHSQGCHRHSHTCDRMKDYPQVLPIPVAPPCIPEYFFKNRDKFTVTKVEQ